LQYTAKLVAPFLLYRAQLQLRADSLTHDGLHKFASQVSVARRIMGFWGAFETYETKADSLVNPT
jgi:hypothetical protein